MKFLRIVGSILKLIGSLLWSLPKLLFNRQKGMKTFKKQLRDMNLDRKVVKELSASYKSYSKIKTWMPKGQSKQKTGQHY